MIRIGLIREGKTPADNRVALTPAQCKWIHKNSSDVEIIAQSSAVRCFTDREFQNAGVQVTDDIGECDILMGIKEIPVDQFCYHKPSCHYVRQQRRQKNQIL